MPDTPLNPDALAQLIMWKELPFGGNPDNYIRLDANAAHKVIELLKPHLTVAQPEVRGYIIVDKKTNAIDWDGELHTSIESAIDSMTGPHQSMCQTVEEEDDAANDGRTAWWRIYSIHTVTDGPALNDA